MYVIMIIIVIMIEEEIDLLGTLKLHTSKKKFNAYQFSRYQIFHEFLLKPPKHLTVVDINFSFNHKYF